MDHQFWRNKWVQNEIAFHEAETNPGLAAHWHKLNLADGDLVFVPLCGKSLDMLWLAAQGQRVLGVELSQLAAEAFFKENQLQPEVRDDGPYRVYSAGAIEIWCGDFFDLPPTVTRQVRAIYDRASLVALPPALRQRYSEKLVELTASGTQTLLLTVEYDPELMDGPPFSVTGQEVDELFSGTSTIERLHRKDTLTPNHPFRSRGKGLTWLIGAAYLLTRREVDA